VRQLLDIAKVAPSSPILINLIYDAGKKHLLRLPAIKPLSFSQHPVAIPTELAQSSPPVS
jgi:hypothetical protein